MPLPTTKTPAKLSLSDYTILMYGPPKVGKSTFCAKAPDALFIATESGLNALESFQKPVTTWDEFLATCAEIAAGGHPFKSVVIDTVDNMYRLCKDYICKRHKIEDPGDLDRGKGYGFVNTEMLRVITRLSLLPYGLYLISHATELEVKTKTGTTTKMVPGVTGATRKMITGCVDMILFCDFETEQGDSGPVERRVIRTKPSAKYDAGDRTGRLPDPLPLDYGAFVRAFEAGVAQSAAQTAAQPSVKTPPANGHPKGTPAPAPAPLAPAVLAGAK